MVVANKSDLSVHSEFHYDSLEAIVIFDWENGYVECSAKECRNVNKIFKELLNQCKLRYGVNVPSETNKGSRNITNTSEQLPLLRRLLSLKQKPAVKKPVQVEFDQLKRRQSMPAIPPKITVPEVMKEEEGAKISVALSQKVDGKSKTQNIRRGSFPSSLRRNLCKVS